MKSIFKILFIATLLSISCINISTASAATGGIMLEPMRIELNENQRYATITVLNQSLDEKVTYNISTLPMRMNQDGTLFIPKKMTKREMISKSMLKFSPRTATISEGGQQTVRIVVRKPPQLPDGEYLTYIRVGPVNNQKKKKKEAYNKKLPQNTSSLTVDFMVGMRIPVIVNQGTPNAVTTIKSLSLVNSHEGKKLKLTVTEKVITPAMLAFLSMTSQTERKNS